jgi:hypothetical protein
MDKNNSPRPIHTVRKGGMVFNFYDPRPMTAARRLFERHLGGLLPRPQRPEREVHIVDGVTYTVSLVWLRRTLGLSYHTSRIPRDVRLARALEAARLQVHVDRALRDKRGEA